MTASAPQLESHGAELVFRPGSYDLSGHTFRLGIDVGSTTVKLAVVDEDVNLVYANYERHHTDVKATAAQVFE